MRHASRRCLEGSQAFLSYGNRPATLQEAAAQRIEHERSKCEAFDRHASMSSGLPPEKWPSLRYGFAPAGGREDGKEAAYGRGDRWQAAAGRSADGTGPADGGGGPGDRGDGGHLLSLAGRGRRGGRGPAQTPWGG